MSPEKQIAALVILICMLISIPIAYIFISAALRYCLDRFLPRDAQIDYVENGVVLRSYYVKRRPFKRVEYYELPTNSEGSSMRPAN